MAKTTPAKPASGKKDSTSRVQGSSVSKSSKTPTKSPKIAAKPLGYGKEGAFSAASQKPDETKTKKYSKILPKPSFDKTGAAGGSSTGGRLA